jgi:hypothetical protein
MICKYDNYAEPLLFKKAIKLCANSVVIICLRVSKNYNSAI